MTMEAVCSRFFKALYACMRTEIAEKGAPTAAILCKLKLTHGIGGFPADSRADWELSGRARPGFL